MHIFAAILVVIGLASPLRAEDILLKDGNIVDPVSRSISRGDLFLHSGKIQQIGGNPPAKFQGKTISLAGKWVVPGFTDMHTHSSWGNPGPAGINQEAGTEAVAKIMLYTGVTSFLDLFADESLILPLRDKQRAGKVPGADLYAAGPMLTCTRGHGTEFGLPTRVMDTPEDARREVKSLGVKRPDVIKIAYDHARNYPSMNQATMQAAIATARELGIKVVVHIGTWQDAKEAVLAGASAITHLYDSAVIPDELVKLMHDRQVGEIPTMTYQSDLLHIFENQSLLDSPLLMAVITAKLMEAYKHLNGYYAFIGKMLDWQRNARTNFVQSLKKLGEGGVNLMTGTDGGDVGVFQGFSVHREMAIFVDSGLSTWQALAAATTLPNEFLGKPSGIRIGSPANLVILKDSPVADIQNTQGIEMVIHHGRLVNRATLLH